MAKKRADSAPLKRCFAEQLAGETPPSLPAMARLYDLASNLYGLRPWKLIDETNLILIRDSVSGELCYCSVMGVRGEVFSLHAYIGSEGYRTFHRMASGDITDPGEFLASMHCVYVEFVRKSELDRQDRELLATLSHPQGRNLASPVFRAIRPGFQPWFVTEDEARTLAECIRAAVVVCTAVASDESMEFWDTADTYPMVTREKCAEPRYQVDLVKVPLPPSRLSRRFECRKRRSVHFVIRTMLCGE